jgi:hypothetical protein
MRYAPPARRGFDTRATSPDGSWDGQEHESSDDDDDDDDRNDGNNAYGGTAAKRRRLEGSRRSWPGRLTPREVDETNGLIAEVVMILDMYAAERDPVMSRAATRPSTPTVW